MSLSTGFRIKSYVCRDGRKTAGQERARVSLWPRFGLPLSDEAISFEKTFERSAATYLEIGFGTGQSLLAIAKARPEDNFIGVETHRPGIGALFLGVERDSLENIRVYNNDVIDVLQKAIPNASLSGVQIFFPDPWPKRRHHPRRLIQPGFIDLVISKLKNGASLHLATDWEDYAIHMMKVLSQEKRLINLASVACYAERSPFRPTLTKFERRALSQGRKIFDLQFRLDNP